MSLDVERIRRDFPNLKTRVYGKPLVYLDNAATTFKPYTVIESVRRYYAEETSNVHRGVHYLSEKATADYEGARQKIKGFLNARKSCEIIFTRGATEAVNLVAASYGRAFLKAGDEIVLTQMEHHSNIVPWQLLREQTGCVLKVAPINDNGELIFDEFKKLLGPKTKFVSVVHVSNSLGTINPVKDIIREAHKLNIPVLVDGAQSVSDMPIDVRDLDCDFFVFSGHKLFGPTGTGVLYAKEALLEKMPPYQGGGDMILSVTFEKTTYNALPYKFEAGTPNIAGVIGLGSAIYYIQSVGLAAIRDYKHELLEYGTRALTAIPGLRLIGTARDKSSILSFVLPNVHAHDLGTIVDEEGVAIRTGHHCTQPVMQRFGVPATARASITFYNTKEEIDTLTKAIWKAQHIFK